MILVFGTPPEVGWVLHDAKTDRSRFSTRSPALCVEAERLRRCGQSRMCAGLWDDRQSALYAMGKSMPTTGCRFEGQPPCPYYKWP